MNPGQVALPHRRGLFFLAAGFHLVAPIVFFTNLTENPYSVQIHLVNVLVYLGLAWTGLRLAKGPLALSRTPLDAPLFLFAVWALITWGAAAAALPMFFSGSIFREGARWALFLWVNAAGVFWMSAQLAGRPGERLTRLALCVAGVSALYGVLQYAGFEPVWDQRLGVFGGRPVSTYGNPNFLSSVLALFLPLALAESLKARRPAERAGWGLLAFLYAAALLATLTRSSWIGAGAGLAFFAWMERRALRANIGSAVFFAVGAGGILSVWTLVHGGKMSPLGRLAELWHGVTGGLSYGSWHQRLLIWRSAWDMWAEQPWVGRGWGLFELFFPFYQARLLPFETFRPFRTHANNAHQLFLEIGCQTGLIGLGIVLFSIVFAVALHKRRAACLPDDRRAFLNACFAGLAAMTIDNVFGNVSLFFAVPAFLFFWTAGQWAAGVGGREVSLAPPRGVGIVLGILMGGLAFAGIAREARSFISQIHYLRGSRLVQAGRGRAAEESFLLSARWRGAAVNTHFERGNLSLGFAREALRQGLEGETARRAEQAVKSYTEALGANAGYAEVFQNRAQAFAILGKKEDSFRDLEISMAINPLQETAYQECLAQSSPGIARERLLEQVVYFFPKRKIAWFQLGAAREQAGKKAEARSAYEQALSLDLDFAEAWHGVRRVDPAWRNDKLEAGARLLAGVRQHARASRWAEGRTKAMELVRLFPDYSLGRLMAADLAAQTGEDEAAIAGYEDFLSREPGHREATENLARVLRRRNRGEEADRLLQALPARDPP